MAASEPALAAVLSAIRSGTEETESFYTALADVEEDQWPAILSLADHPSARVRLALIGNLPFFASGKPPAPVLVATAVRLSTDTDATVRSQACFVLAQQWQQVDTPEVREALALRLDDLDRATRCEALLGLARRGDDRAAPRVLTALSRPSGDVWLLEMLAAGALGDHNLHPFVLRHLDGWDDEASLHIDAVRRLTDPGGPGSDLFRGVAELYRRRAHHLTEGDLLPWWTLMLELLELAPRREWEFYRAVRRRLNDDAAALEELDIRSAFAPDPHSP